MGIGRDDMLGKPIGTTFFGTGANASLASHAHRQALDGTPLSFEFTWGGRIRQAHIEPLRDAQRAIVGTIGVALDVTEQRDAAARVERLSSYDQLTDLPNRALFEDRVSQAVALAHRYSRSVAVLFLDLDRFKIVNEALGHAAGDEVLRIAATRIGALVREGDTLARFSGDEFALVLTDAADRRTVGAVAQRILDSYAAPLHIGERELYLTTSVGIAMYPDDAGDMESLIKGAEMAMYESKRSGRNVFTFFAPGMRATPVERLTLQRDVHSALRRDQFAVVYQPIVRADGRIAGVETLLRWRHPTLGMLLPDSFIPIVEESGAIQQVGEWVLERAVAQLVEWDRAGLALPRISVNVSARQFEHKTLRDQVERVLAKYGVAPERIELEVTESSVMRDANAAVKVLCELKDLGLRLAIDDFGIGYTSLSYLKRFPIDVIKIDRSFVRGLGSGLYDQAIVRAITMLAQIMGFTTVAEGVEHTEQAEYLRELDCDEMQGFLFSPPVPEDTCAELLRSSLPQVEAPA